MTTDLIGLLSQPVVILIAVISLFIGRIVLHARRLRSVSKDPDLAKLLSLEGGEQALIAHKKSLNDARITSAENLDSARKILRNYAEAFKRSRRQRT